MENIWGESKHIWINLPLFCIRINAVNLSPTEKVIHLIGCGGFLGKSMCQYIKINDRNDFILYSSNRQQTTIFLDIHNNKTWQNIKIDEGDKVIILSWRNLPNYNKVFHFTENLFAIFEFVCFCVDRGVREIDITGTCYEYGMQNGCLDEGVNSIPISCYAVAKDSLRRILESYLSSRDVVLKWFRIFYPYGEFQNPNSLYPSLMNAIKSCEYSFKCSQGDQIRDFIHVDECSLMMVEMIDSDSACGIINIGSGNPISIREFLEKQISINQSKIKLELGFYPRRKDEPLAFWADISKYNRFLS